MEAENGSGEEDEDSAPDQGEYRAKEDEDEFSLEEVLRLGGTQVIQKLTLFRTTQGLINFTHVQPLILILIT